MTKINNDIYYYGKKLLITGGTGSFGNAIVNRFLNSNIESITILSRDEKKQDEQRKKFIDDRLKFVICDVRDAEGLDYHFKNIDYVFHAAALKQVPSCEMYPYEAYKTNVVGSKNVIDASIKNNVKKCILLSTDKAVYPINSMGISKAMMEKLVYSYSQNININTIIACTRYGNVMGSRGSVIPLFLNQIKNKQKLTITDPNMTRFLMSLEDSVELVDFAFKNAKSGDLYVMKSPSAKLSDLVVSICELEGVEANCSIIGTRHSEKLYETLVSREEMVRSKDMGKFFRICSDERSLNYKVISEKGNQEVSHSDEFNSHNANILSVLQIKELLTSNLYKNFIYN